MLDGKKCYAKEGGEERKKTEYVGEGVAVLNGCLGHPFRWMVTFEAMM